MSETMFIVRDSASLTELSRKQVGGKGYHLLQLRAMGLYVPSFYVITPEAFRHTLRANELDGPMRHLQSQMGKATPEQLTIDARHLRQAILRAQLPETLSQWIHQTHEDTFPPSTDCAIRSSDFLEDASRHSFAGIYDTCLSIVGLPALEHAIKQVWASMIGDKAMTYCWRHRLQPNGVSLAIIVQKLVSAQHSGVMFTQDPCMTRDEAIVIRVCQGLGQSLVDGQTAGDGYRMDRRTGILHRVESQESTGFEEPASGFKTVTDRVSEPTALAAGCDLPSRMENRPEASAFGSGFETGCTRLSDDGGRSSQPRDAAEFPSLEAIRSVAAVGLQIERHFGTPQDIEFCWDETGRLCLLQARPISTAVPLPSSDNRLIWDNSNIVESYSGITLPMTFSFIRRAYSIVYHCFAEVMGISRRRVQEHQDAFDNMLGLFRGRVYYNLKNWYRLVSLFPGYSYNRQFMESMMGVKETFEGDVSTSPPGFLRRWFVEFPALVGLVIRSTWNFSRIDRLVHRFDQHFERCYGAWSRIDFERMPPHEIMQNYRQMERKMLWNWKAPIINDFYVMVCYGILRKMCESWCDDQAGTLQNGLLCGVGQLESAAPADQILQLTRRAEDSAALRSAILEMPLAALPDFIASRPEFSEFHAAFDHFLECYGLRCVDELKLESRSYRDHPEQVYRLIRNYLQLDHPDSLDAESRRNTERAVRRDAERHADRLLREKQSWMPKQAMYRYALAATRRGIRHREHMRMARTRIYGVLRSMLRALGKHFHQANVLESAEDIFYLTIDEVWDFIQGTAVTTQLRDQVAVRRAEYDRYRSALEPIPDRRFETIGVAYLNNSFQQRHVTAPHNDASSSRLKGIGCCPGTVEDDVQVVVDPNETTHFTGGILVAERTDPGWVPIYPAFRGILVERGSVLSHSAIVAREFGIPTIVGVHGLTQALRSGQRIRMNGQTGEIEILEPTSSSDNPSSRPAEGQRSEVFPSFPESVRV